jgi:hypothetical protein
VGPYGSVVDFVDEKYLRVVNTAKLAGILRTPGQCASSKSRESKCDYSSCHGGERPTEIFDKLLDLQQGSIRSQDTVKEASTQRRTPSTKRTIKCGNLLIAFVTALRHRSSTPRHRSILVSC